MAGRGAARTAASRAAARLAAEGHAVERIETRVGAVAEAAARSAAGGADRIVAIGGDGTIAEVAAGILASDRRPPLAIVPRGTANVLALNLAIPTDFVAALETAVSGAPTAIDVGYLDGAPFLLAVAAGFHAEMVALATRGAKQRWGMAAYGLAGLRARRAAGLSRYRLVLDGAVEETEATMIQVMNCGAVFRRSWEFAPGISPTDGRLDVLVYRATTLTQYLTTAAHVVRGTPTATELVDHRRARRLAIEADPPVLLQRDGETAGETPAVVEVTPRALPVLLPAASPWAA